MLLLFRDAVVIVWLQAGKVTCPSKNVFFKNYFFNSIEILISDPISGVCKGGGKQELEITV